MEKPSFYILSGPCGCGKSTVSRLLCERLSPVYRIEGDALHDGFCEKDGVPWEKRLEITWEHIRLLASNALSHGLNTVVDYVVEEELPELLETVSEFSPEVYYIVLTASAETLRERLLKRGDPDLTERSLFLRQKLMEENKGFLLETENKTPRELAEEILGNPRFRLPERRLGR